MNKTIAIATCALIALAVNNANAAVKLSSAVDDIAPYVSPNNSYSRPTQFT
jgi:hypothetical protein